jgi:uncharacterized protein (TIGR02284 family)
MANETKEVVSVLEDLIETCEDGINGFRAAADAVHNLDAKALFESRVARIRGAEDDLRAAVRRLGGDPPDHGHVAAPLHRGWINLKSAITGHDDDAIVAEVERGEDYAVQRYQAAVSKGLPPEIRTMVEKQLRGATENLHMIRDLHRGSALDTTGTMRAQPRDELGV